MRQPARPDLWEARVRQPPGPTRQARGLNLQESPSLPFVIESRFAADPGVLRT